jgi:hypothetical protein
LIQIWSSPAAASPLPFFFFLPPDRWIDIYLRPRLSESDYLIFRYMKGYRQKQSKRKIRGFIGKRRRTLSPSPLLRWWPFTIQRRRKELWGQYPDGLKKK